MRLSVTHGDLSRKSSTFKGEFLLILPRWLYPPEILPLTIRAKGASLSTASNWFFNWVVGEMTPILQELITWRLYLLHAFFCAVSFVVGMFTVASENRLPQLIS
jgi:hypothetical protein